MLRALACVSRNFRGTVDGGGEPLTVICRTNTENSHTQCVSRMRILFQKTKNKRSNDGNDSIQLWWHRNVYTIHNSSDLCCHLMPFRLDLANLSQPLIYVCMHGEWGKRRENFPHFIRSFVFLVVCVRWIVATNCRLNFVVQEFTSEMEWNGNKTANAATKKKFPKTIVSLFFTAFDTPKAIRTKRKSEKCSLCNSECSSLTGELLLWPGCGIASGSRDLGHLREHPVLLNGKRKKKNVMHCMPSADGQTALFRQ